MSLQRTMPIALLILVAISIDACRQEVSDDVPTKKAPPEVIERTIQFPAQRSLGVVKIRPNGSTNVQEWREISDAAGPVGIPKDKEVMLQIKDSAGADFSALASIGANAVQELNLENSGLTDDQVAHIRHFTGLTGLNLNSNPITDAALTNIEGLTNLKKLALGATKITDAGLQHVENLKGLQRLWLQDTGITDEGLKHLSKLAELQALVLYRTHVTDAGLAYLKDLPALQRLGLQGTDVTDAGLVQLQGMKSLREVSVVQTKVTEEGSTKLRDSLPDVQVFTKE